MMLNKVVAVLILLAASATAVMATEVDPPTVIPEPSLLMLMAGGLGGVAIYARNRMRK